MCQSHSIGKALVLSNPLVLGKCLESLSLQGKETPYRHKGIIEAHLIKKTLFKRFSVYFDCIISPPSTLPKSLPITSSVPIRVRVLIPHHHL